MGGSCPAFAWSNWQLPLLVYVYARSYIISYSGWRWPRRPRGGAEFKHPNTVYADMHVHVQIEDANKMNSPSIVNFPRLVHGYRKVLVSQTTNPSERHQSLQSTFVSRRPGSKQPTASEEVWGYGKAFREP